MQRSVWKLFLTIKKKARNPKISRTSIEKRIRYCIFQATVKAFLKCLKDNDDSISFMKISIKTVLESYSKLKITSVGVVMIMGALTQAALQLLSRQPALHPF
ncbi:BEM_HP_G0080260.mRNA.1.CDS.1 [Saccharomyces cerevisiae]|nr:BEM_HP_G0080260.mRNA.1.CDS.1 [Saccharomyces cerevisiae]CAI6992035.1 BEM_HP_G0080260.mRNA.1.CDS.1 [Saccharomyces cerevisiae]